MDSPLDYITFSGSGEPTLHSQIGHIIGKVKKMTSIPVAVITNGSLLFMDEVKGDLGQADLLVPSLDAVSRTVYETINRPEPSLEIERVIQGLIDFREQFRGQIWLEILYCRGVNDDHSEVVKMKEVLDQINPERIQLNTVYRPPAEDFASVLMARIFAFIILRSRNTLERFDKASDRLPPVRDWMAMTMAKQFASASGTRAGSRETASASGKPRV